MTITKCVFYVSEAATLLNCAPYQIYRLIHTGQLPAYKNENGKAWHIPEQSIRDYIHAQIGASSPGTASGS